MCSFVVITDRVPSGARLRLQRCHRAMAAGRRRGAPLITHRSSEFGWWMANWTLCSPAPGAAAAPLEPLRRASVIRSSNRDISRRSHSRSASTAPSIRRRRSCVRRAVARRGTHARSVHVADGHHGVAMHQALVKAMPVRITPNHTEHKGHHYERSANHLRPEQARPELQPALREDQHPGEFQPRLIDHMPTSVADR